MAMMKKGLLIVALIFCAASVTWAQWKPVGIEAAFAPSVGIHAYETNNKLIFKI